MNFFPSEPILFIESNHFAFGSVLFPFPAFGHLSLFTIRNQIQDAAAAH